MANEAQREYWNTAPGQRWVTLQAAFDRSFQDVTALLLARSEIRANESVLDVGCGSAATTLEAARRAGAEGRVLGVDVSAPLLELARERTAKSGLRNVDFLLADAQTHGFAPGQFDLAVSRFGVMFFDAPVDAFHNLRAALRPGGRICFVCWAALDANPWFQLPLAAGVSRLGPPIAKPAHAPGPLAFGDPRYLEDVLAGAGYSRIDVDEQRPTLAGHATPEEEAAFAVAAGPLARLFAEKKPEAGIRDEIARDIAEAFRPFATDQGLRIPSTVYFVTASA
jgi:SAM-dependent methyltransferase